MFCRNALFAATVLGAVSQAAAFTPHKHRRFAEDGKKLAVYWGANDYTTTLDDVCSDDSYGIVNLAFLSHFKGDGGYPTLALSPLNGPSPAQQSAGATSLQDGTSLVPALQKCRDAGKKIILSMGGANAYANVVLASDDEGEQIADTLWNLFGAGTDEADLRPFGSFQLDGFDIDNESGDPTGYIAMIDRFRSHFSSTNQTYTLSAAPGCGYPGDSITPEIASKMDIVWVQYYDTEYCVIGNDAFYDNVKTWSSNIPGQLYIGAIASGVAGDIGYMSAEDLVAALQKVDALGLPNYGGAMLWEAQLADQNGQYQKTVAAGL